ncbi:MAG: PqqD family protein [Oscillospiraceae bacterium]|nr:PqqD family protein [Oscillospiraceae bacterium]
MAKKMKVSANYMECVPVRGAMRPWRVRDDGMVEIDMENKGFYHSIAQKFFKKPRVSHIALDRYGSVVWQNIDGKNTVTDIIHIMENEFPDEKDRMLDRVVTYMATLQRNSFIIMK